MSREFQSFADWQAGVKAQRFKRSATNAEHSLMSALRQRGFVFQFAIGKYVVDFCHPDSRIIVELDGDIHYTDARIHAKDVRRDKYFRAQGFRVLHFDNADALRYKNDVLRKIDSLQNRC